MIRVSIKGWCKIMNYLQKTRISREHYNLLLNWRRIAKFNLDIETQKPFIGYIINLLPVELSYMKNKEYRSILTEWVNGADVFEVIDDQQSVDNSVNHTTLGDVIAELQEQLRQVGNINVNVYDSDNHMVITYD